MTAREIEIIVKEAARKAGLPEWKKVTPHCLRKTFESILRNRLSDGSRLDMKTQEYFMGHILPGSQDPYFDRSKINHMRNQFSRLKFGRVAIENKFRVLKAAVARAFEDTDIDPEQVIEEYVKLKHSTASGWPNPSPQLNSGETKEGN